MPVKVEKQGSGYVTVEKATGKVKGHSDTREKAEASARAINAALHGWRPKGKSTLIR